MRMESTFKGGKKSLPNNQNQSHPYVDQYIIWLMIITAFYLDQSSLSSSLSQSPLQKHWSNVSIVTSLHFTHTPAGNITGSTCAIASSESWLPFLPPWTQKKTPGVVIINHWGSAVVCRCVCVCVLFFLFRKYLEILPGGASRIKFTSEGVLFLSAQKEKKQHAILQSKIAWSTYQYKL